MNNVMAMAKYALKKITKRLLLTFVTIMLMTLFAVLLSQGCMCLYLGNPSCVSWSSLPPPLPCPYPRPVLRWLFR